MMRDFDRLVYVTCILERYSTGDCALLLEITNTPIRSFAGSISRHNF